MGGGLLSARNLKSEVADVGLRLAPGRPRQAAAQGNGNGTVFNHDRPHLRPLQVQPSASRPCRRGTPCSSSAAGRWSSAILQRHCTLNPEILPQPHFACGAQARDPIPQFRSWALEQGLLTDGKIKVSLHTLPPATQLLTPCCSQCRKQCVAVWYFC